MKTQSNKLESRMKIVILHGKHNCGKTTTFNLLYDELIARGAEIIVPKKDLPARKDFECILKYKEKKVALFSLGDYMFAIGNAVGYYTKADCDVLIVAHSLKTPIHKNVLFKTRKYPFAIINKELNEVEISKEEAIKNIITEIE